MSNHLKQLKTLGYREMYEYTFSCIVIIMEVKNYDNESISQDYGHL